MTEKRLKTIILGCLTLAFSAVVYFMLIPKGIYVPKNIPQVIQSPAFFPTLITGIIAFLGLLLLLLKEDVSSLEEKGWNVKDLCLVLFIIVSNYFLIQLLGLLYSSIIILFLFMPVFGARNWKTIIGVCVVVPVILHYFFNKIAQVQFPQGFLIQSIVKVLSGD